MIFIFKNNLKLLLSFLLYSSLTWWIIIFIVIILIFIIVIIKMRQSTYLNTFGVSSQCYIAPLRIEASSSDWLPIQEISFLSKIVYIIVNAWIYIRYQLLWILFSIKVWIAIRLLLTILGDLSHRLLLRLIIWLLVVKMLVWIFKIFMILLFILFFFIVTLLFLVDRRFHLLLTLVYQVLILLLLGLSSLAIHKLNFFFFSLLMIVLVWIILENEVVLLGTTRHTTFIGIIKEVLLSFGLFLGLVRLPLRLERGVIAR